MGRMIVAVIPARFGSTRFPGKPLVSICGLPMIQHVYERIAQVLKEGEEMFAFKASVPYPEEGGGIKIRVLETGYRAIGVDVPQDVARVEAILKGEER